VNQAPTRSGDQAVKSPGISGAMAPALAVSRVRPRLVANRRDRTSEANPPCSQFPIGPKLRPGATACVIDFPCRTLSRKDLLCVGPALLIAGCAGDSPAKLNCCSVARIDLLPLRLGRADWV